MQATAEQVSRSESEHQATGLGHLLKGYRAAVPRGHRRLGAGETRMPRFTALTTLLATVLKPLPCSLIIITALAIVGCAPQIVLDGTCVRGCQQLSLVCQHNCGMTQPC